MEEVCVGGNRYSLTPFLRLCDMKVPSLAGYHEPRSSIGSSSSGTKAENLGPDLGINKEKNYLNPVSNSPPGISVNFALDFDGI